MANDGADGLYSLQTADTIRKDHYIVINGHACKVFDVRDTPDRKGCLDFVAFDIFNESRQLMLSVISSSSVQVPCVKYTDYRLLRVKDSGHVVLEVSRGEVMEFPVDDDHRLLDQLREALYQGKILYLTLVAAMGFIQIYGVKEFGNILTG